jgi:hypothetical protein
MIPSPFSGQAQPTNSVRCVLLLMKHVTRTPSVTRSTQLGLACLFWFIAVAAPRTELVVELDEYLHACEHAGEAILGLSMFVLAMTDLPQTFPRQSGVPNSGRPAFTTVRSPWSLTPKGCRLVQPRGDSDRDRCCPVRYV